MKSEIEIFKFHPLYNKYAASNLGKVINIRKMKTVGSLNPSGYNYCSASGAEIKTENNSYSYGNVSTVQFRVIKSLIISMI